MKFYKVGCIKFKFEFFSFACFFLLLSAKYFFPSPQGHPTDFPQKIGKKKEHTNFYTRLSMLFPVIAGFDPQ
jgi:hypothetical protein